MLRFFAICVVLAALCLGGVMLLGKGWSPPWLDETTDPDAGPTKITNVKGPNGSSVPSSDSTSTSARSEQPSAPVDDRKVNLFEVKSVSGPSQSLILQDARILAVERQDVPSERDGKLLFLATPVEPGEVFPASKLLKPYEIATLAIEVPSWRNVPVEERLADESRPDKYFRKVRSTDTLAPGTTTVVRRKVLLRRLDIGDRVREGQLLGIVNPALAREDLVIKQEKVQGALADVDAARAFKEESDRALKAMRSQRAAISKSVTDDEFGRAVATLERYKEEEKAKRAAMKVTQRELSQAWVTLTMYDVRASIDGVIKSIYKYPGEAVKNLDPVLQIQNPDRLRVELQVDVQEALGLRHRLETARKYRDEARRLRLQGGQRNEATAQQYMRMADQLLAVEVEASRIEPPRAVLAGHFQEVTCVGVTRDPQPRIVSGSEDHTVRIWERVPGAENRWQERVRLDHHAVVRALACTTTAATRNLLLTGTATGRARIFDLDNLKAGELLLQDRHAATINCVAFNKDGTMCATGGEDRAICLWETTEGKLLGRYKGAHGAGVTSLAFTPAGQLVSAGKDRKVIVWNLVEGGEGGKTLAQASSLDRRSGDVPQLGIDPAGEHVLFDEGRELRVYSLASERIEGTLANPPGTAIFSTLALYSPDGTTILTNSNAVGRLQLWRAPSGKVRPSELRNFAWSNGQITSAAFDPKGTFVATGTQDARVLVWTMPRKDEAEKPLSGELSYVEEFLDTSLRRVTVRANVTNPGWIIPGGTATVVVPPLPTK
jgi:multidrug efflux pump subunit AcrA (membrane-fusion protein)